MIHQPTNDVIYMDGVSRPCANLNVFWMLTLTWLVLILSSETSLGFTCENKKIVQDVLKCNGINDCGDSRRSDEQNCPQCISGAFHCNSSLECVPQNSICNSHPDCVDNSDELYCENQNNEVNGNGYYVIITLVSLLLLSICFIIGLYYYKLQQEKSSAILREIPEVFVLKPFDPPSEQIDGLTASERISYWKNEFTQEGREVEWNLIRDLVKNMNETHAASILHNILHCNILTKNYVQNPSGEEKFENWTVIFHEEGIWGNIPVFYIESQTLGMDTVYPSAFVSSYDWCTLRQRIDLWESGLTPPTMKSLLPFQLKLSQMLGTRVDHMGEYIIEMWLETDDYDSLVEHQRFKKVKLKGTREKGQDWCEITSSITVDKSLEGKLQHIRYLVLTNHGRGDPDPSRHWNGHFGIKFAKTSVTLSLKSSSDISFEWVPDWNGSVPDSAVVGGYDSSCGNLYVARIPHEGALIPGKLCSGSKIAQSPYNCSNAEVSNEYYEVLVAEKDLLSWVPTTGKLIPKNAIEGGQSADQDTYFIGRLAHNDGVLTPGYVDPKLGLCYIAYNGNVLGSNSYEILILNKMNQKSYLETVKYLDNSSKIYL